MNYVSIRDALVSAVAAHMTANHPSVPVFYDNAVIPDPDTVADPLLNASVHFNSSYQIELSRTPALRIEGTLILGILNREGKGIRESLGLGDSLTVALANKNLSNVQTGTLRPGHAETHDGWHLQEFLVDFWSHSIT